MILNKKAPLLVMLFCFYFDYRIILSAILQGFSNVVGIVKIIINKNESCPQG
jgi:hypothetical protein